MQASEKDLRRRLETLFDAAFYRGQAGLGPDEDAFAHYVREGWRLRPNLVFDPAWYVAQNPDAANLCPLLHYAEIGEPAGRDPSALFDVAWYRRTYGAERPLAHYLARRFGPFSPIPEFDADYYLKTYPDVGAARMDPFLHYMHFGYREFRKPSAGFNPRLYAIRHLSHDRAANPIAHLRANPAAPPQTPAASAHEAVRAYARRGPRYEERQAPIAGAAKALVLAFHLTQYHRIPENDAWWGEGFTEWTQLARGQPRFAGHYQPRIPGALGFYDLSDPAILRRQAELAKAAGIGGFVFYYYDFDGRRLLEKPLEAFLATPDIDIGFCLMWANENWTRRWDGAEDEVLIAQSYDEAHEERRAAEFARHFRDPRYIRLEGRPLLMVYRASLIPDTAAALARWRGLFLERFGEHPIFVMAQTFDDLDPRPPGFDGAVEFPPHKLTRGLPQIYDRLEIFDDSFEAAVFAYDDVAAASLAEPAPPFPLIRTALPSWDNDARRQGKGLTLVGATPRKYERWLSALIAEARPFFGERIVCVNAWNEWSEGAYLEPDVHFGWAYLNATAQAIFGRNPPKALLAGLDPDVAALGRDFAARFGCRFELFPDAESAAGAQVLLSAGEAADADALFAKLWPGTISVFIVHRGEAGFLARLQSVFAQTHPVLEIVVIDESGGALEAVEAAANTADRDVSLMLDASAGAVWGEAAKARGDFVWIVGSDGLADPTLLAALSAPMRADPRLVAAFCDSQPAGQRARPSLLTASPASFVDGAFAGADFLAGGFTPALSATLWRREALARVAGGEAPLPALAAEPDARFRRVAEALDFTHAAE
jgi:hypothetical protein